VTKIGVGKKTFVVLIVGWFLPQPGPHTYLRKNKKNKMVVIFCGSALRPHEFVL